MITEDQGEVVGFLSSAAAHGGAEVERIDTHASIVFLAGAYAWKLKRAVRYEYLDFSTASTRRAMCEAELRVNQRTAPDLYDQVVPVTRERDGSLALGGAGEPLEWVLRMRRFDQASLLEHRAQAGELTLGDSRALGTAVAAMHAVAERCTRRPGAAAMRWVVEGNARGFAEDASTVFDSGTCARLTDAASAAVARHQQTLDERAQRGKTRRCHGDLHLGNIVMLEGRPIPFDAVEFNEDITCIDVLCDLAFLLMDLMHRGLVAHANAVWNSYLAETLDLEGPQVMPLFLSSRAAVRAKTTATLLAVRSTDAARAGMAARAQAYLSMAATLLEPRPGGLLAIGGFSGSGKSTLAAALAPFVGPSPGAVVVRSDEVRKHLCGVAPSSHLGLEGYLSSVSERVYAVMHERVGTVAKAGGAAIADAVYSRAGDRLAIEAVARETGVPFVGIWLDAPEPVLIDRVQRRVGDLSDADASVVSAQVKGRPAGSHWQRLDATRAPAEVLGNAVALVTRALRP